MYSCHPCGKTLVFVKSDLRPGHTLVRITRNYLFTQKTQGIRSNLREFIRNRAPTEDDTRKSAIDDKHHLIGQ